MISLLKTDPLIRVIVLLNDSLFSALILIRNKNNCGIFFNISPKISQRTPKYLLSSFLLQHNSGIPLNSVFVFFFFLIEVQKITSNENLFS